MKKNFLWWMLLLVACASPSGQEETDEPINRIITDFTFGLNSGSCRNEDYQIGFLNASTDADSVRWDFGDGSTTRELNPEKIYSSRGDFQVTLTVFRSGVASQVLKTISVPDRSSGPAGSITCKRSHEERYEYEFAIETDAQSYYIYFGDGNRVYSASSKTTITHTYSSAGTFKATLNLNDRQGKFTSCYSTIIEIEPGS